MRCGVSFTVTFVCLLGVTGEFRERCCWEERCPKRFNKRTFRIDSGVNFAEKKRVKLISIYCNEMRHRHVRSRKFSELQLQCNNLIEQKDLIFSQSDMMILLPGSDIEAQTDFLLMRQFMIYKNQLKPMAVYNVANSYEHFSELLKMNEPFPYEDLDSKLIIESNPWKIILRITELSQRLICAKH